MEIWVALVAFLGTAVGSISGILVANKLVNYRLEQLEAKVHLHNNLVERMYKVEDSVDKLDALCCEKFTSMNHRVKDLEKE